MLTLFFAVAATYPILFSLPPLYAGVLTFPPAICVGTFGNSISGPAFFPGREQQGVFLLTASDNFLQGEKRRSVCSELPNGHWFTRLELQV